MKRKEVLALVGASRQPNGQVKLPDYKKSYTESQALERIAKDFGAKDYKQFQNANRQGRFKDYAGRMKAVNITPNKEYYKDYFNILKAEKSGKEKAVYKAYSKVILKIAEESRDAWRRGGS